MIQQHDQHPSSCLALETARYLTDPLILQEYIELQQGQISSFGQLWKNPKLRKFALRCSRLLLFTISATTMISIINQTERWNELYFWLLRLL